MATTKIRGSTQILAGTVTNAEIASAAAIATSKLADGAEFLKRGGTVALTASLPAGGFTITGLGAPSSADDAATKGYVDATAIGLDVKPSVRAATTANITLSNTQTIDGVALSAGNRVLVKDQTTGADNGLYVVVSGGAWTRATDADASAEVTSGMFTFVEEGTVNGDSGWVLATDGAITLGTTALVFSQFSSAAAITAGAGLTKTGSVIDFVAADASLTVNANDVAVAKDAAGAIGLATGIKVNVDDATIEISSNALRVKDAGVTSAKLAAAVAGDGLSGGAGTALSVNVAAAGGLEIATDAVQVKIDSAETVKSIVTSATGTKINTAKFIVRETPAGTVNGANATFTLANAPVTGKEQIYLNGLLQESGDEDYGITGATIVFVTAPATGDRIRVSYLAS